MDCKSKFNSNFSARKDGDYDEPIVYEDYDKLKTDNVYEVPNIDDTDYGELSGGVDFTHPKYADHVYERTMEEVNEIMKSEYTEASLNSGVAPSDATQVDVNVKAGVEQGERDETHDPRYVWVELVMSWRRMTSSTKRITSEGKELLTYCPNISNIISRNTFQTLKTNNESSIKRNFWALLWPYQTNFSC